MILFLNDGKLDVSREGFTRKFNDISPTKLASQNLYRKRKYKLMRNVVTFRKEQDWDKHPRSAIWDIVLLCLCRWAVLVFEKLRKFRIYVYTNQTNIAHYMKYLFKRQVVLLLH